MGRFDSLTGKRPGSQKENSPLSYQDQKVRMIINLHESVIGGMKNVLQNAMALGEELHKIKENIGHGNWIPWIEKNLPFSERSARNYISIYKNRDSLNRQPIADLKSAIKFISAGSQDEKEINPKESFDPRMLFKKHYKGERLNLKERTVLKDFLTKEKEKILSKTKKRIGEIEKVLSDL
ncbi:hypothetical protein LPTSP4_36260 [Leptospira ryugenii]|uniref:DUF3102 domain-containing protein n=1 Tax=Leptospira ryugenii TaxID=1917863 RepID=A0A2P2E5C7_9LEPT|nr:DUF3102 domain-containing protein [Leptospira ryugenii]GBF52088.1 hypothetical protein LPTSP4_36260 [Leptospira ryugenii]